MTFLAAAVALYAGPAAAAWNDDFTATVGVKGWASDWTTWHVDNVFFNTGRIQIAEPVDSTTRFAVTPTLNLRYRNALISASYLASESYPLTGAQDKLVASRNELDVSAGYYVLPGVAITVGYKQVRQDYGDGAFVWSGPTAGIGASAPLGSSNFAVYGQYGYGLFKLKTPQAAADAVGDTSFNARYSLSEFGLSYAFGIHGVLKALRITAGYRAQILTTRGYRLSAINSDGSAGSTAPNEHDFTQGPTVALSASL